MTDNWRGIWNGKGAAVVAGGGAELEDLIREDGFDSGAGDHSLQSWRAFTDLVYRKLEIDRDTRMLEVGCGCGAFLFDACHLGASVTGVDYSHQLIAAAGTALPMARFAQAEACALPFPSDYFDVVVCHSVFQYFPSEAYAQEVVAEMTRVLDTRKGRMAILDINDAAREDDFHRIRSASIGAEAYRERYADLPHRFYRKQWFSRLLDGPATTLDIADQAIDNYQNSAFRFNVFVRWSNSPKDRPSC